MNDGYTRYKFFGGPHDGELHLANDLLKDPAKSEAIAWEEYESGIGYVETDEGLIRKWTWTGPTTAQAPEGTAPVTAAVEPAVETEDVETPAQEATPVTEPTVDPADWAAASAEEAHIAETAEPSTVREEAPPVSMPLKDRRVAAKLSRKELTQVEGATLTEGKIARIETKGGTEAEVAAYVALLEALGA